METHFMQKDAQTLTFLVVSDTHNQLEPLVRLGKWMEKRKKQVDFVLHLGDIAHVPSPPPGSPQLGSLAEESTYIGDVSGVIHSTENVCARVLYIPGNHDPNTLFSPDSPCVTPYSMNIHKKWIHLTPDLVIGGMGGSVPSFQEGIAEPKWSGFPWTKDEELGKEMEEWMTDTSVRKEDSVILMTHSGPLGSGTTLWDHDVDSVPIQTGSKALRDCIRDKSKQIVLCAHGHAHMADGNDRMGTTRIVNPGAMKHGRFALVTVETRVKDVDEKIQGARWGVTAIENYSLSAKDTIQSYG